MKTKQKNNNKHKKIYKHHVSSRPQPPLFPFIYHSISSSPSQPKKQTTPLSLSNFKKTKTKNISLTLYQSINPKMEQNLQVIHKRIWSIARAVYFMLRKGFSKKLLVDLNMMLKRGKIAGKALGKLMHHHHNHNHHHSSSSSSSSSLGPHEYEFSCSNTPAYTFPSFNLNKRNKLNMSHSFFGCAHAPPTLEDDPAAINTVKVVMEMFNNDMVVEASPALPGFGRSPFVRPLRITDSPFPLRNDEDNGFVDKAAEEFIEKFYRELKKQKING